jgi:hypothetical protein
MKRRDLPALTGVLFVVLLVVGFAVGGDSPDTDAPGSKVISFYKDNDTKNLIAVGLIALSAVALLFFASVIRERAKAGLGGRNVLPNFALGAAAVTVAGLFGAGVVHFTLADVGDKLSAPAAQALNALDNDTWVAFAPPFGVFVLASGLAAIRGTLAPTWLGWVAVVLFVLVFTPAGFFAALLAMVWVIVVSVLLFLRGDTSGAAPSETAAPPVTQEGRI